MTPAEKLRRIFDWTQEVLDHVTDTPAAQADPAAVAALEARLGVPLPDAVAEALRTWDGEPDPMGCFLGHEWMSMVKINRHLDDVKQFDKPENPTVPDEAAAEAAFDEIAQGFLTHVPAGWAEVKFGIGPGVMKLGAPKLPDGSFAGKAVDLPREAGDALMARVRALMAAENAAYGWDELEFTFHADGTREVTRKRYDNLHKYQRYHPEGAIRDKYMHLKWLPLVHDGGGNYIGVDLDPGPNGTVGQVIVFGPGEDDHFVIAPDWDGALDHFLGRIESDSGPIREGAHLHDLIREAFVGG
ncbi:SMI1/KNR4 family protein [Rhodovulum sp. DZ06]|uniref:SMI1/KNR4 family protein n=1 Tax=Rhodovulum sp. DZ06 TaxID=3425126 RepID=UPI003D32F1B7